MRPNSRRVFGHSNTRSTTPSPPRICACEGASKQVDQRGRDAVPELQLSRHNAMPPTCVSQSLQTDERRQARRSERTETHAWADVGAFRHTRRQRATPAEQPCFGGGTSISSVKCMQTGETGWVHCDAGSSAGTNQASLGLSGGHNKASAPPRQATRRSRSVATPRALRGDPVWAAYDSTAAPSTPLQWMPCHCHHLWTAQPRAAVRQARWW